MKMLPLLMTLLVVSCSNMKYIIKPDQDKTLEIFLKRLKVPQNSIDGLINNLPEKPVEEADGSFMTEMGIIILKSELPLGVLRLLSIFVVRTIIIVPIWIAAAYWLVG